MASPAIPSTDPAPTSSTSDSIDIYQTLSSYSFTEDPEFKLGLAVILGQPGTPATDEQINRTGDLIIKAKCFYFSKKFAIQPPINHISYKHWLEQQSENKNILIPSTSNNNNDNEAAQLETAAIAAVLEEGKTEEEQPVYPSSFARIVELITTGQPIPGIQQIPDTVLTGQETASTAQRRRKPWERDEGEQKEELEQKEDKRKKSENENDEK
ncbi:hypothetical protein MGYG_04165 [Nannizzia gypsea CBS 118893]|uniref:Uncharacterized protein n=1 Tax=Arthroderma gypseum (strain ATCC MYA-4604 / CBS 118893) TaxID=535722 RepID=E4UV44_ARTGP|nr:hypothetical protein MGYG_04165 [Nannizzia gypsea CBS 118893]EFR01161.1 hypothetical protein MGYG_04165 [Nannizzia gypsea CBS 118893]